MIGFWLFFTIIIFVFCLMLFLVFALDDPDDEDRTIAKRGLAGALLSWTWPVALPALIIFFTYKGIKNVF